MKNEVSARCRQRFEVEARPVEQTREDSPAHHQSEELEVLVNIAERILFLETRYDCLSSGQFASFVKLLHNLVSILKLAFLHLLVLIH